MSRDRFLPPASTVPLKRDAGRILCRMCRKRPAAASLGTYCSNFCLQEWLLRRDPQLVRAKLIERDNGICQQCGTDTKVWIGPKEKKPGFRAPGELRYTFEAHHRQAVIEGGGCCGLDGYATLCRPCHTRETVALAQRLAVSRHRRRTLSILEFLAGRPGQRAATLDELVLATGLQFRLCASGLGRWWRAVTSPFRCGAIRSCS